MLNSTIEKFQEFIDKVSELRFIKIKERQVNKFNKLIQKQGNKTWFSAVPSAGNPWANNSSGEHADATSAALPASPVRSQAPQAQAGTDTQAISTSPPAFPVRSQVLQVEITEDQAVSKSPPDSAQVP